MATLSALLKTWVILQTLCLVLAQVVSGREGTVWLRCNCLFLGSEHWFYWDGAVGLLDGVTVFENVCRQFVKL